jgi:pyruvate/2-oxoglutarate dehydrogenase complex dihydrolipoamide acyltransferase (E2) component
MATEILMPALSPTMEEGTLAKWLVKEGDTVSSGDIIAEIETDKATMEFEAVDEGTIGKLLIAEGTEGVKVNSPIAVLLEDGEDASAVDAALSSAPADDAGNKAAAPAAVPRRARHPRRSASTRCFKRLPRLAGGYADETTNRPRSASGRHGRGNAP